MIIKKSPILSLKIIKPNTFYRDKRGIYLESFNKKLYKKIIKSDFVEDDFSLNKKGVFKGIHGDYKTWKLISCVYGICESIIVNCDKNSKKFGLWEKFILSSKDYFQVLIPPSYGNSFLVLSDYALYHYKQTKYYGGQKKQFTINYKDPFFKIKLSKNTNLIISKRDKEAKFLSKQD
jgi:dTDP-4-dehydrorhamnose 3,5-epimerase